jgi:hypothetical protein
MNDDFLEVSKARTIGIERHGGANLEALINIVVSLTCTYRFSILPFLTGRFTDDLDWNNK